MISDRMSRYLREIAALRDALVSRDAAAAVITMPGVIGATGVRNSIYVVEPIDGLALADCCRPAGAGSLVLLADVALPAVDNLVDNGWSFRRELRAMTYDGVPAQPAIDLTVEPVAESNVDQAQVIHDEAFGLRVPVADRWLSNSRCGMLLARDGDGRPIAIGGWQLADRGARIAAIGTVSDQRGRGLGGAMTVCALNAALASGAEFAFLEATADGSGVYRRVGFHDVGRWTAYERRQA